MLSKYSAAVVVVIYFVILVLMNFQAVKYLEQSDKGFVALFYSLVVIQIGIGLVITALAIDPSSGRNKE